MLAEKLGKTREELLQSISSQELTLWIEEYKQRDKDSKMKNKK